MMKIIAHRGVRGPFIENSLASFEAAVKTRADAVEFDIQATKDGQLVVLHTMSSPKKVFGINQPINNLTWAELQEYKNKDSERMPTFDEVMAVLAGKPVMTDIKDTAAADLLVKKLHEIGTSQVALVNSLYPEALSKIKKSYPELNISLQTYKRPFKTISLAKEEGLNHVALALYLLNPLTYWAARRAGLKVVTYQNYASVLLTWRWLVRLIQALYPGTAIVSDRADKVA